MNFKSVLKPEGSIMASFAAAGSVIAIYNMDVGPASAAHASPANHPSLESSRKKAGYTAFLLVSSIFLITRDANVGLLGYGTIAAMEIHYRSAIMADPVSGQIVPPATSAYADAENVVPIWSQGQPTGTDY